MRFDIVDPVSDTSWDSSTKTFPQSSVFSTQAWIKTLSETYGFNARFYRLVENAIPVAVLPIMEIRSQFTGVRGVSLPFTDACSPLYHEKNQLLELFEYVKKDAETRSWKYIELRDDKNITNKVAASFWGHSLSLNISEDDLFRNFNSSNRRAIRRSQKAEVTIQNNDSMSALREFYRLQSLTRRRHGLPPQPFRFFKRLHRNFLAGNGGNLFIAKSKGRAIAGAVFLKHNCEVVFKYGASDKKFQNLRANNLLMWEAIKYFRNSKMEKLDFGRTDHFENGLRHHKLGWGTQERQISYVRYNLADKSFESLRENNGNSYNKIFKIMPLFANQLIGSILYRHVA